MFMGEYHHSIDSKGRIIVPSKVRDDLGENFIVTRGLDGCLFLYPKCEWDKIIAKYKELPDTKDKRQFMRIFLSGATICEYDKQGRINIPNPLIEFAKLEKDCIIIKDKNNVKRVTEKDMRTKKYEPCQVCLP